MRSSGGGMRPVGIVSCHVQLCCLSSSSPNNAIPCLSGFLTPPSWWTSERKTKTACAIHFRSAGPLFQSSPLSPGSHAVDAAASGPSRAATRSGSTPTGEGSMRGSSINAWRATKPGIVQSSNAEMYATSIPPCSRRCSPTILIGSARRRSISNLSNGSREGSMSARSSKFASSCCATLPIGHTWTSTFQCPFRPVHVWIACLHPSWTFRARN